MRMNGISVRVGTLIFSACQQLLLGLGELRVAQHAGVVQLRELLQLSSQVRPASRGSRGRCGGGGILRRRRRDLLLLSLRISHALLISRILLLLRSRLLSAYF